MWQETEQGLYKQFTFSDFQQAFAFMVKVAEVAEQQQHHPRWTNEWNRVELWLSTHDASSQITEKDYHLAEAIDVLAESQQNV